MKEILKSKVMIGFAVFVLSIFFISSTIEAQKNDLQTENQASQLNQNVIK